MILKSRWRAIVFIQSVLAVLTCSSASAAIPLVRNGISQYAIVLDRRATATDRKAAHELQRYVQQISGALLPIRESPSAYSIVILSAGHHGRTPVPVKWDTLGEDGFTIRTVGKTLLIAGGTGSGSLNGVYTFLESYLGCRKYTPSVDYVPRTKSLVLPAINETEVPSITFRDASVYDPRFMAWHKLHNHDDVFGMYVHTFRQLVPPEKYFRDHPEYFSKVKSGRIADGQLCLTNPDVFRIVVRELRQRMNEHPEKRIWSVSQNDTFSPCECDSCRALDSLAGSPMGSLLTFVNRVADEFPGKTISTLAYQYSRSAPHGITPRPNVNIMLCSIECNRSKPLAADPNSASFVRDLTDWATLTSNIYLWDYVVQFRNYISPFPNLRVLQPNIQLFARNNIRSVFEQGSAVNACDLKELRIYLVAKLLWNPNANVDSLTADFLHGYFGKAAPFMRRYLDRMHDTLEASGQDLVIYGYPLPSPAGFLSAANLDAYSALFDSAEAVVRTDLPVLNRVRLARLSLSFAILEQAKVFGSANRGFFVKNENGAWGVRPSMDSLLNVFVSQCTEFGIKRLEEHGKSPDDYRASVKKYEETGMKNPLALFRPVAVVHPPSLNYSHGDPAVLTDGLHGWNDYNMNWLGFEGEDMIATIDLGSVRSVHAISTSFLQDNNAWIFLPDSVDCSISNDGLSFQKILSVPNVVPADSTGAFVVPFRAECSAVSGRYVRVSGVSMKTCPPWHKGAGLPSWVFSDEIVVE